MNPVEKHDGDCTIYSAIENGNATDGICTCGFGLQKKRHLDYTEMFSDERLNSGAA